MNANDCESVADQLMHLARPGGVVLVDSHYFSTVIEILRLRAEHLHLSVRTAHFDDLRGYILRSLGANTGVELRTEVGSKKDALLGLIPDLHNLYAIITSAPRGNSIKFRAEAMAPEPEFVARYENDLAMYYGTNIARITTPLKPPLRIIEFSVPASLVSMEVRFFYRTPEELMFFRENNPRTTFSDIDATVPIEGVTFLL